MNDHHGDLDTLGWYLFTVVVIAALSATAVLYAVSVRRARRRGHWPARRTVSWFAGLLCAAAALVGPIAAAAHTSFTAHMGGHLLLGMAAPVLLVLGAPLTLALRALPVRQARRLSRLLRNRPLQVLMYPATAAVLNVGGLWVLYSTSLYELMHVSVLVHAAVHTHIVLTGYLLTASLAGLDPNPHRASMKVRSIVLVAFIAAHSVLAKWLYAHPPAGVELLDAQTGSQLMYYGGDILDIVLIVLLFNTWYTATRPRTTPTSAPLSPGRAPLTPCMNKSAQLAPQGPTPAPGARGLSQTWCF